jgi:hypothetical protein
VFARTIDPAAIGQLQHRNIDSFHMHVRTVRPRTDAADVGQMRGTGEQRNKPTIQETRRGQDEIVQVPSAHPRIVGDVDVPFRHCLERKMADEMLHRFGHRVDVAGRSCDRLSKHPSLGIEHAGGKVAAFPHDRAESGPYQGLCLFFDDRDKTVPHDLHTNRIEGIVIAH